MLGWFKARAAARAKADELYGVVVAAARRPRNYSQFRVPDSAEGRFEMVALYLFLVLERAKAVKPGGVEWTRDTIEAFVTDMDDCMREMGVGDVVVPKRVRRAAAAFYERAGAYRTALAQGSEGDVTAALDRYIFKGSEPDGAAALARVVMAQADALAKADDTMLASMASLTRLMTTAGER